MKLYHFYFLFPGCRVNSDLACFVSRKLYWVDEGGFGVPPKIGKVNMDGSKPVILLTDIQRPEAITIDLKEKMLYFSAQYPGYIKVMDVNGNNVRTLVGENVAQPKALGVYENRLYYLDPKYERIGRVDLPAGDNPKVLLENEPDLKTFVIYQKQQPC